MNDLFEDIKFKIGFGEMYEIGKFDKDYLKQDYLGRFIQFSDKYPGFVDLATDSKKIIGVSSIISAVTSDNPDYWFGKYAFNELCDTYVRNEPIAVGKKHYDSFLEKSFITTHKVDPNYEPIVNNKYDESKEYIKRSMRQEWLNVNLLGKVVVYDDGTCNSGDYCKLYEGKDEKLFGTAIKATNEDVDNPKVNTYYVIYRVSPKTIMILFK